MWQPGALLLLMSTPHSPGVFSLTLPAGSPLCAAFCCAGGGADAAPDHHPLPEQGEAGGVLRQQGGARKGACVVNRTRQLVVACTRRSWRSCTPARWPWRRCAHRCPSVPVVDCWEGLPTHLLHSLPSSHPALPAPLPCRLPQSILQQEAKHAGFRSEVLKSQELQART